MDFTIKTEIVPDDGTAQSFWRNGEHWIRVRGTETRMSDLAPHLEAEYMLTRLTRHDRAAMEASKA